MADIKECTVTGHVANETERAEMAISAAVTECAEIWNLLYIDRCNGMNYV